MFYLYISIEFKKKIALLSCIILHEWLTLKYSLAVGSPKWLNICFWTSFRIFMCKILVHYWQVTLSTHNLLFLSLSLLIFKMAPTISPYRTTERNQWDKACRMFSIMPGTQEFFSNYIHIYLCCFLY